MTLDILLAASLISLLTTEVAIFGVVLYFALHGIFRTSERNRFFTRIFVSPIWIISFFGPLFAGLIFIEVASIAYLHDESKFYSLAASACLLFPLPVILWNCDNEKDVTTLKRLKGTAESLKYLRRLTLTPFPGLGISRSSVPEDILRRLVQGIAVFAASAACVFIYRLGL